MNRCPASRRLWIPVALALPLVVVGVGVLHGQGFPKNNQPKMPVHQPPIHQPPVHQPAVNQTVWSCSKCKAVVGHGPTKPNLFNCPQCGVRLSSFSGGGGGGMDPIVLAVIIGVPVVMIGAVAVIGGIMWLAKSTAPAPRRRRRTPHDDNPDGTESLTDYYKRQDRDR